MAEESTEEQSEQPKKKNPMMLIIIGVVALLLIIVVVVAILVLTSSGPSPDTERVEGGAAPGTQTTIGPVVELDQFIVNLLDSDGRRYLRIKISLELSHRNVGNEVQNKMPMIRDLIIRQLSSKRFDEIATENGKQRLREELRNNINRHLIDGQVQNVFFTTFVVQ